MTGGKSVRWIRLLAGLALAPILPMFAIAVALASSEGSGIAFLSSTTFLFAVGSLIAYFAIVVLGLPTHLLLSATEQRDVIPYVLLGALAGFVTVLLISALYESYLGWLVPLGLAAGTLNALAFWLIRRPDRVAPNPPTPAP